MAIKQRMEAARQSWETFKRRAGYTAGALGLIAVGIVGHNQSQETAPQESTAIESSATPSASTAAGAGKLILEAGVVLQNDPEVAQSYTGTLRGEEEVTVSGTRTTEGGDTWVQVTATDGTFEVYGIGRDEMGQAVWAPKSGIKG